MMLDINLPNIITIFVIMLATSITVNAAEKRFKIDLDFDDDIDGKPENMVKPSTSYNEELRVDSSYTKIGK